MTVELVLAILAVLLSILSFVLSIIVWLSQKNVGAATSTLQVFAQIERNIGDVPTVLRFHDITPQKLREAGVTPNEFAYLVSCFSAYYIYHYRLTFKKGQPYSVGSYAYNLLKSPSTREAWPLIKLMMGGGEYVESIEATIEVIKKAEERAGE